MTADARLRSKIIAVVPAHDPDARLQDAVRALAPQVDHILVVDDGSKHAEQLEVVGRTTEVMTHDHNRGIAAALNTGIRRAIVLGADHVLTVDQDTVLDGDYVLNALATLVDLESRGLSVAAVGAWTLEPGSRPPTDEETVRECRGALQSGLLMPVPVIRRLGRYRESLFIDCVETEFLLRARRRGLRTYVARACTFDHRLGEEQSVTVLGRTLRFPLHSATRRYYITRNRAWLTARHGMRQPLWTARQLKDVLRVFLLSVLSARGGRSQVQAARLGLLDFIRGRGGPVPEAFARSLSGELRRPS